MQELNYKLSIDEILKITKGKLIIGNEKEYIENFCRDSREIKQGDVYLGIKGEEVNGSIYFEEALKKVQKVLFCKI